MHSSPSARHIAFVVPRFGEELWGGAELHARWLAERLAARGDVVEILTTCAVDHHRWTNDLPAGTERHGNLLARRFRLRPRDLAIHGELSRAIEQGAALSADEESLWLRHGASSAEMEDFIADHGEEYDAILAMPYLFGVTYFAYKAHPDAVGLIPCLHDEPYAYFAAVAEMLEGARALFFNTRAEASFAASLVTSIGPSAIVGVGVDRPTARKPLPLSRKLRRRPSLLFVGRREGGKNTPLLIDYFVRYKQRRGGPLMLMFSGSGDDVPEHKDIIEVRPQWDDDAVFRAGTILCNPSVNESLSLVLLDGWNAARPALVNGDCAVTREHCERSNGGLWFTSYAEFEAALDRMLQTPSLLSKLGRNGQAYVRREYSWSAVLARFDEGMRLFEGARQLATHEPA